MRLHANMPQLGMSLNQSASLVYSETENVLSLAYQLVRDLRGYTDPESLQKLDAMIAYLSPKLNSARANAANFARSYGLTERGGVSIADYNRPYQPVDSWIYVGTKYDSHGTPIAPAFTLSGRTNGNVPYEVMNRFIELESQVRQLYFRIQACKLVKSAIERGDNEELGAILERGQPVPGSFYEDTSDPLNPVIFAPIVIINPLTGKGDAVFDVVTPHPYVVPSGNVEMPGSGVAISPSVIYKPAPGFTPHVDVGPETGLRDIQSRDIPEPRPSIIPYALAAVAAYFAVKG